MEFLMKTFQLATLLVAVLLLTACDGNPPPKDQQTDRMKISDAIAKHSPSLMKVPGVVGIYQGQTNDVDVIRVMVTKITDSLTTRLPKELEGYTVEVEETGEIIPMQ